MNKFIEIIKTRPFSFICTILLLLTSCVTYIKPVSESSPHGTLIFDRSVKGTKLNDLFNNMLFDQNVKIWVNDELVSFEDLKDKLFLSPGPYKISARLLSTWREYTGYNQVIIHTTSTDKLDKLIYLKENETVIVTIVLDLQQTPGRLLIDTHQKQNVSNFAQLFNNLKRDSATNFAQLLNNLEKEGATRFAQIFNNLTHDGSTKFVELFKRMSTDEIKQFATFLSQASEEDVKQLAKRLNTEKEFVGKWWLLGK